MAESMINQGDMEVEEKKEKSCKLKSRMEPIHQKYKANENISKHNPKKKTKANNQMVLKKILQRKSYVYWVKTQSRRQQ